MSYTIGEGDPRGGGSGVPFFDCAIHLRTNQSEVFSVLFTADKANISLYIFMRKVGGVVSHFIDCAIHQRTNQIEVFGVLLLLTKHIQASTCS